MISDEVMQTIGTIGDWYVTEESLYFRIVKVTKAPHLLPKNFIDRLALKDNAYYNTPVLVP